MTECRNATNPLKLGKTAQLGQLDPNAKLDIVQHGIQIGIDPISQSVEHADHGIKPFRRCASDQKVGFHVIQKVEQLPPARHGPPASLGEIADCLKRENGIEPCGRRCGCGGADPCSLSIPGRHKGWPGTGLACRATPRNRAGSICGLYAQGIWTRLSVPSRQILPSKVKKRLTRPARIAHHAIRADQSHCTPIQKHSKFKEIKDKKQSGTVLALLHPKGRTMGMARQCRGMKCQSVFSILSSPPFWARP